jgi:MbtH protein
VKLFFPRGKRTKGEDPKRETDNVKGERGMEETEDTAVYKVVVNHEEQYSIWFADREPPLGWREVGKSGPKAECLAYIKEVWTDMRPLSLRKQMEDGTRKT